MNNNRLLKPVEIDLQMINEVLKLLKLTSVGGITVPEEGRIASNVRIDTVELGPVFLRFYPAGCQDDKLESGSVHFEIESLHYLASHGFSVPAPLAFGKDQYVLERDGITIFAYALVPGKCLKNSELSKEVAQGCGALLSEMIAVSELYQPEEGEGLPRGDIEHILAIHKTTLERYPQLRDSSELIEMSEFARAVGSDEAFRKTPKGIVHADFFFENILYDSESKKYSVIDFGDAYYGYVLMDVVIGAMEFCVMENREWDLEMFSEFLVPNREWLKKHGVSFDLFHRLLMTNCLRFAIYTMPMTLEEGMPVRENPYVDRFYRLKASKLKQQLAAAYHDIIK